MKQLDEQKKNLPLEKALEALRGRSAMDDY